MGAGSGSAGSTGSAFFDSDFCEGARSLDEFSNGPALGVTVIGHGRDTALVWHGAKGGNLLTDDVIAIRDRLRDVQRTRPCAQCWTSCRGFAECMQKPPRLRQFKEFFTSVRPHA